MELKRENPKSCSLEDECRQNNIEFVQVKFSQCPFSPESGHIQCSSPGPPTALRLLSVRANLKFTKKATAAGNLRLHSWFSVGCSVHFIIKAASTASPRRWQTDVRFTPESGRVRRKPSCLLWANSGHRKPLTPCSLFPQLQTFVSAGP